MKLHKKFTKEWRIFVGIFISGMSLGFFMGYMLSGFHSLGLIICLALLFLIVFLY